MLPVRCAHPSFWHHRHAKRGAMRPPPIAASLLLIRSLKIDKKLSNSGRPRNGLSRNKMLSFRLKIGPPASWDFFFPLDCYTLLILLFLSLLILLVLFSSSSYSSYSSLLLVSVNFCDFLTPTDAVIENPQKYLAAEKYY